MKLIVLVTMIVLSIQADYDVDYSKVLLEKITSGMEDKLKAYR